MDGGCRKVALFFWKSVARPFTSDQGRADPKDYSATSDHERGPAAKRNVINEWIPRKQSAGPSLFCLLADPDVARGLTLKVQIVNRAQSFFKIARVTHRIEQRIGRTVGCDFSL